MLKYNSKNMSVFHIYKLLMSNTSILSGQYKKIVRNIRILLLLLWFSTIKPISLGQEVKYVTILKLLCPSLIG
jgi:hypothetical protein